jgi:hypothetical protein
LPTIRFFFFAFLLETVLRIKARFQHDDENDDGGYRHFSVNGTQKLTSIDRQWPIVSHLPETERHKQTNGLRNGF